MKTVTLKVPENVELNPDEIVLFLAAKLYESGKLTLGQSADLAGLSKTAFAEILGRYGVSLFNYPASDIKRDASRI